MEKTIKDFNVLVDEIMQHGLSYRLLQDVMHIGGLIDAKDFDLYSDGTRKPTEQEFKYLEGFLCLLTTHRRKDWFIKKLNRYVQSEKFMKKQESH